MRRLCVGVVVVNFFLVRLKNRSKLNRLFSIGCLVRFNKRGHPTSLVCRLVSIKWRVFLHFLCLSGLSKVAIMTVPLRAAKQQHFRSTF